MAVPEAGQQEVRQRLLQYRQEAYGSGNGGQEDQEPQIPRPHRVPQRYRADPGEQHRLQWSGVAVH